MKSLISIIVPVYNIELYIADCVETLIHQTYSNIEIVLVDDGSNDNSSRICDEYGQKDSRVIVIHKQNGGLVSARNSGYHASTGEWIMYLDGDDWLELNTCEKLISITEKHSPDVIFWNTLQNLNGKSIKRKAEWDCKEQEKLYAGHDCEQLAYNTLVYSSGISTAYSKLLRRDFAQEEKLWHNEKLKQGAEGIEFSLRVFNSAKTVFYINKYLTHYRYNEDSISKRVDEKNTVYIVDCFNEIYKYIHEKKKADVFMSILYQRILYVIIAIAMSTYFHPNNKDSLVTKVKKFKDVFKNNIIIQEAIKQGDYSNFDKLRKLTMYIVKLRLYFLLPVIARTKYLLIKRGVFNYS